MDATLPLPTEAPPIPGSLPIEVAGEAITLLAQRAAYWPAQRTLLVADLHLDKCETMRIAGMPIPRTMDEQIARLEHAISLTGALRILVLGDLLHAPAGLTGPMVECFAAWRARTSIELALVPGNHDRGLVHVADAWRMTVLNPVHAEGPFTFTHIPRPLKATYVWAGHLHPAITLRSAADSVKMPCFCIGGHVGVLPAFTRFAAGGSISRCRGDRVFAVAGDTVVAL